VPIVASDELRVALEAARRAGDLLRSALGGPRSIAFKGGPTDLVTEMDARAGVGTSSRTRPRLRDLLERIDVGDDAVEGQRRTSSACSSLDAPSLSDTIGDNLSAVEEDT
jgi:hypothetical protein